MGVVHSNWGDGKGQKDSSSQDGGGSRKSLLLVLGRGKSIAESQGELMSSDLAPTVDPAVLWVLCFRIKIPNDHWTPPDDITSSWPRLHSLIVNVVITAASAASYLLNSQAHCSASQISYYSSQNFLSVLKTTSLSKLTEKEKLLVCVTFSHLQTVKPKIQSNFISPNL